MKLFNKKSDNITNISVQEAHKLCQLGVPLIDVREPEEVAEGCAQGCLCIPFGQLKTPLDQIPKDKPVMLICQSGRRSLSAAKYLKSQGYSDVKNVQGGFMEWKSAGMPIQS